MIGDRTYRWAWEQASGTLRHKNLFKHRFGYTSTRKKVAGASATAVLAATATATSAQVITAGITNPDVPRALKIATGGTTANIAASTVVITGTNVEGKIITENFAMADNLNGEVNGTKAFKTVTSVAIPAQDGASATISVGYQNILGLNHRLVPQKSSIVVTSNTSSADTSAPTIQAAPSATTIDAEEVENNTVTPATSPDGTTFLTILYWYHNVNVADVNDEPVYSTSTSTSSTSTSSSTSSTSTSTSSTSSSTSSTSSSTSSTSTSTTTVP